MKKKLGFHSDEEPICEVCAGEEATSAELNEEQLLQVVQVPLEEYQALLALSVTLEGAEQQIARWRADFENYRRRMQREKEEMIQYAASDVLYALLPVLDNFDRAMTASYEDPARMIEGIGMIYRQQCDIMMMAGLQEIIPLGQLFDPSLHEAVARCEADDDTEDNTIVEVLQKGYLFKDKLLRPAMVKVAQK